MTTRREILTEHICFPRVWGYMRGSGITEVRVYFLLGDILPQFYKFKVLTNFSTAKWEGARARGPPL